MARPGVTYYEVAKAANEIHANNELPTIDRIRQRLGTGSNTTIAGHLKKWKQEHMPLVSSVQHSTIPPELLLTMQSLWETLQEKAEAKLIAEKEAYETILNEKSNTINELTTQQANLSTQHTQLIGQYQEKEQALTSTNNQHQNLQKEHDQLNIRFEEQVRRLEDRQNTITQLNKQVKQVTDNLDHFREAAQAQREKEQLKYGTEIQQLKAQIKSLNQQLTENHDARHQLTREKERSEQQYQDLSKRHEQLTAQLQETKSSNRDLTQSLTSSTLRFNELMERQHQLTQEHSENQTQLQTLDRQLAASLEKAAALQTLCSKEEDRINELLEDKATLKAEVKHLTSTVRKLEDSLKKKAAAKTEPIA